MFVRVRGSQRGEERGKVVFLGFEIKEKRKDFASRGSNRKGRKKIQLFLVSVSILTYISLITQ